MQKRPWQSTAVWGVESAPNRGMLEAHFDRLKEGKRSETAEYEMTCTSSSSHLFLRRSLTAFPMKIDSTAPCRRPTRVRPLYLCLSISIRSPRLLLSLPRLPDNYFDYANPPLPFHEKRSDKIASILVSNCHPKNARTLIMDELMSLLPGKVDSFGACRNNANADATLKDLGLYEAVGQHTQWNTKVRPLLLTLRRRPFSSLCSSRFSDFSSPQITLIGHYKFVLAVENSNDYGYVTEKVSFLHSPLLFLPVCAPLPLPRPSSH